MAYEDISGLKSHLNISGATYDTFLGNCADFLSELADTWSNRTFAGVTLGYGFETHTSTFTVFLEGNESLVLPEWPVQSVSSITNESVTVTAYILDAQDGYVEFLDDSSTVRIPLWGKVVVDYTAGYSDVPEPVKMFIRRGTSYIMQRSLREGIGADLLGDSQVTFKPTGELYKIFQETCGSFSLDYLSRGSGVVT